MHFGYIFTDEKMFRELTDPDPVFRIRGSFSLLD